MKLLIAICVAVLFLILNEKALKKYSGIYYGMAVVLGVATALIPTEVYPLWLKTIVTDYFNRGTIATAFFVLVMVAILMPKKSYFQRLLMSTRGETAIIASLLILSHNIAYGKTYFLRLFTDHTSMQVYEIAAAVLSLLMIALLIPLTITSFKCVRKKMPAKKWKKLQRLSYLFYAMIYVHVAVIYSPRINAGDWNYLRDFYIYTAVFAGYAILRVHRYAKIKSLLKIRKSVIPAGVAVVLGLCVFLNNFACNGSIEANAEAIEGTFVDGEYEGEAMGYSGKVKVRVKIEDHKVISIDVLETSDDDEYFSEARAQVVPSIVENQSTEVDAVSGATYSSNGIKKAVERALEKAAASSLENIESEK